MLALPMTAAAGDELDSVRRRTAQATAAVTVAGAAATVSVAAADPRLALLPLAFVLGWLNLAGA